MDRESQQAAVESLREWSKWLIGLDFAAATGCVVVLQGGAGGLGRLFLVLAIAAFALSVLCAVILTRALVLVVEQVPLTDDAGVPTSIETYRLPGGFRIGHLALGQLLLLAAGGAFFLSWIVL